MGISGLLDRLNSDNPYVVTRPRTYLRQSWSEEASAHFLATLRKPVSFWKVRRISRNARRSTATEPRACGVPSRCKTPLLIRRTIETFVLYSYCDPPHSETPPLGVWTCTDVSPTKIDGSQIRVLQNTPFLSNPARDRIAPDFTIRHPVRYIVALQETVEIFRAVGVVFQD